jgi:hypothetical protein
MHMAGYGDEEGFTAWLLARGHTPPAAPSPAVLLQRAEDYLDAVYGARLACAEPSAALTAALERATYAAAWHEAQFPGSLSVSVVASQQVKRERIDVIETEYFQAEGGALASATPQLSLVDGILAPFLDRPAGVAVFVV